MRIASLVLLALLAGSVAAAGLEEGAAPRAPDPVARSRGKSPRRPRRARRRGATIVTPDRKLLEGVILPHLAQATSGRVLWVGCCAHTVAYARGFGRRFHTIDVARSSARYGAKGRHVVDTVENLAAHYPPGHFEVILFNGILGFGVDDTATAERALAAVVAALAPGGILMVGHNELPEHAHLHPYELEAMAGLEPVELPCLGTSTVQLTFRAPVRDGTWTHTYDFFRRPV